MIRWQPVFWSDLFQELLPWDSSSGGSVTDETSSANGISMSLRFMLAPAFNENPTQKQSGNRQGVGPL
jgi:hypothetical protein